MIVQALISVLVIASSNFINESKTKQDICNEFLGAHQTFGSQPLTYYGIPSVLDSYVAESTGGSRWARNSSFSVADINGGNPNDIVNWSYDDNNEKTVAPGPFSEARFDLYEDGTKYVGCAINALYSELEYFGLYGHFDWLGIDENGVEDYSSLAKYAIQNTSTISIDSDNIFAFPASILLAFNSAMTHYGYNNILTLQEGSGRPDAFIDSINNGYPIIWGCSLDADMTKGHYLVVYGYEEWICTDSDGVLHSQIMFKTRYNWYYNLISGPVDCYIHPDMFNYVNVALYPKMIRNHYIFNDNDITSSCYYPYASVSHNIVTQNGNITGTHLRTGYVVDSDNNHYLTMSSRRENAGVAQIVLNFPETISEIYWKYALWGANERFNFSADTFTLEGKYNDEDWEIIENLPLYLLTTNRNDPDRYHKLFEDAYNSIRITLTSTATGDRNKGRVIFKDIMAFGDTYL